MIGPAEMSVENFDHIGGALAFLDGDIPENCFLCGKPLAGITVYWHGATGGIALHPDCSERLGSRLICDGINANLIKDGQSVTSGVGIGLVPGRGTL